MSIGDALAAARRQAGLTITQVSQRTCIRETIVRGIERGDYSACGGDFYARGHIRSIARAVGLDPDELIREYDATQAPPQPITAADVFQPFTPVKLKERKRPNWTIVLLVGVIAVLGIAGFRYFSSRHSSPPSRPTASTQPDHHGKPHAKATPVAQGTPHHVRLTMLVATGQVTWAELSTSIGKVLFMGDVSAGKTWTEPYEVYLRLGNPAAVTLYLNGTKQAVTATNPVTILCTRVACH